MAGASQNKETPISAKDTMAIMSNMWHPTIKDDVLKWVMYSFPWGVPNTPLEKYKGPRKWQQEEMQRMTEHIKENKARVIRGELPTVYKFAMTSGRGPGKSAFVAMVTLWYMSCVLGGTAILSANNDTQLTGKTFGEIGKWKTLCLSGYWFEMTQKKLTPQPWFSSELKKHKHLDDKYYYAEGVLWNEDNPDAFAGAHNDNGMLLIFDEASGIPTPIWTVSEGFFTEPSVYRFWLTFSNPRRNTGAFFECFHSHRNYWNTRKIDSRDVEGLDHGPLNEIVKKYGEDSDTARIEVKGEFPSQGDKQFINRSLVADAICRDLYVNPTDQSVDRHAPLVIGCDPARFGDDSTVIRFRQGRDARSIPAIELKGADNMKVVQVLTHWIDKLDPDGVFIDAGSGSGIIDRMREMGYKVHEVWFGSAPEEPEFADHRTELWSRMREWLSGGMIDNNQKLADDLCGPEYEFAGREDKIKLEAKEKMKKRGLSSPDHADALAVTFHLKLARKDIRTARDAKTGRRQPQAVSNYKPFG